MLMLPDFRVRQRDFLLQITRAITAQLDLTEVLRRVLHASVAMMAGQIGVVALRAEDGYFYVRATSGLDTEYVPMIDEHLHEMFDNALDSEAFNDKLRAMSKVIDPELRQSIALPLSFAGAPLGLLIVFRSYRSTVTPNDLQVLQSFADQAAIAVHNAQLYETINQEKMRLGAILDHSGDGILIVDRDLSILHFNDSLSHITGWQPEDAINQPLYNVLKWETLDSSDLIDELNAGWPFTETENPNRNTLYVEGELHSLDGLTVSVGITYAPMIDRNGQLTNIIANVRDISNFKQAQEMQNIFISGISHELKTPVAIIKGYAATLRREDAKWDEKIVSETLAVIEDEADRLTSLIQDLLTASKLQAKQQLRLDIRNIQLDFLAEQVVERFSKQTQKHQFRLAFSDDVPTIEGDEVRLRQVFDNLISNAIKYSPDGGLIEVGSTFTDDSVTVYVKDSGIGMSERDRMRVFDRFFRADSKLSRRTQGTGLGLYLAKAIIDAHHGVIDVESIPNKGSTFYFTLPLQQPETNGE